MVLMDTSLKLLLINVSDIFLGFVKEPIDDDNKLINESRTSTRLILFLSMVSFKYVVLNSDIKCNYSDYGT